MSAYYNENDKFAAAWLRELIKAGLIADGDVDERSIEEVTPEDVRGYTQAHFFAGIGGWSYALRLAGWTDTSRAWTGSCPCQPLSCAGRREGHVDRRHLWPAFHDLIAECQPPIVFGEQVASADGREWLAGVRTDLEALGYACGAADLCAAGAQSPQIRQRLYWLADAAVSGSRSEESEHGSAKAGQRRPIEAPPYRRFVDSFGNAYRIPEPCIPFLADGFPGILDRIRAAGNAIVPQVAQVFIEAYCEARGLSAQPWTSAEPRK